MRRRALEIAAHVGVVLLLAFYFAQHWTLATNQSDGALLLTYVDDYANGKRFFLDVADAYGPLNWTMPVLFYRLAGQLEFGVRVWMLLLKLIMVGLTYGFVRRAAGVAYGAIAAFLLAALIGQAWQSLQTPYVFLHVAPWVVGTWYLVLFRPFRREAWNLAAAGALTAGALFTKVNSGMFLLAGGAFHTVYLLSFPDEARVTAPPGAARYARLARLLGVVAFGAVFYAYVQKHFNTWYFAYLGAPMLLGLGFTWHEVARSDPAKFDTVRHLRALGAYIGTCATVGATLLVGLCGWRGARDYLKEQAALLTRIDYAMPFDRFGEPGMYVGLNENYWLQLPWLLTLAFAAFVVLQHGGHRGERAFGSDWPRVRSLAVGVFMFGTLAGFTMYSRADETHVFQAMILVVPAIFLVLSQVERLAFGNRPKATGWFRVSIALGTALWSSTILVKPNIDALRLGPGDFTNPKLRHITYRPLENPYVRDYSPDLKDRDWDHATDEAAEYLDSITPDGSEVLLFDPNRLLTFLSNTRPHGGRWHFYFYLVSVGILDRKAFDAIVPARVVRDAFRDPPPVLISSLGRVNILEEFPEYARLRDSRYVFKKNFRHMLFYERKPVQSAAP